MASLTLGQSKFGMAVFANKDFKNGENIIVFNGKLMKGEELPELTNPEDDRYIQIGKNEYLGPSGSFDDFFNHSCNPNCGLRFEGGKVILIAIKNIKKGEEIVWDYSTTMDEDNWEMDCMCGNKNCRKRIRDFKYLPEKIQQKYLRLGIVPEYIASS